MLFRHPTRQLTSSAKAKEVRRPPDQGAFLFSKQKGSLSILSRSFYYAYFEEKGIWETEMIVERDHV
jgi:hypothetical protein